MYRFVDAALVRCATRTPKDQLLPWPRLVESTSDEVAQWRCWLQRQWARDEFAAAIEVASPLLARKIRDVCAYRLTEARRVRRVVMAAMRYKLRSISRATPFGLFAGVAPARFDSTTTVSFGDDHQVVAQVDAEWLADVITRLESCPELLRRLSVVVNNLAFVRDGRVVVGCRAQSADPTCKAPAEVSVRHTTAVESVLHLACSPIAMGKLIGNLTTEFPRTPESVLEGMLRELVAQRVLISSLRAPMTVTNPFTHLVSELVVANAEALPQLAPLVHGLRGLHAELPRHRHPSSDAAAHESWDAVTKKMAAIGDTHRAFTVDLRVDVRLVLPEAVMHEAQHAAAALARLTPHPFGTPGWRDYHRRFLERYGIGALVPIREIVDADIGLGYPAGYRGTLAEPPAKEVSERDRQLLSLAQTAALEGRTEVILDDQAIANLTVQGFDARRVQPHTELTFRIDAESKDAVDQAEFVLVVVAVSRAAGTTTGRFLELLDSSDLRRMAVEYGRLPVANKGALLAQLSCPPLYARTESVARSPAVLPAMVSLAEQPGRRDGLVPLDDLAVSGDAEQLCLMSLSLGRPVEATMFSAVEFTNYTHPLARFLCEISRARVAPCNPFSWGAGDHLPFLPRLRYRRTILSPARWLLSAGDLPGSDASWPNWVTGLTNWRRQARVPKTIYLGDDDRRLSLDLDETAHLHLLRSDLDRTGRATLTEAPDANASGWFDGRAHEIVVPLASTGKPRVHRTTRPTRPLRTISRDHGHLPGDSEWLFVKLYGHPDRHTAILTLHLPELLAAWDQPPEWWFLPYQDPDNHLRLRFRLACADAFGQAGQRIGAWAATLGRCGLVGNVQFDTYYPETGRFGSGVAMTAVETVFAADSIAAAAQRAHITRIGGAHHEAITAASLVDLTAAFTGSVDEGAQWLVDHLGRSSTPAAAREIHDQAVHLADPRDGFAAIRALPDGERITTAWTRRRSVLAAYRHTIKSARETDTASVLTSLLHLHNIRMSGIAPSTERACHRLARAAALNRIARGAT